MSSFRERAARLNERVPALKQRRGEAARAIARIGLRNFREFFTQTTVPVPGRLDPLDPGPCAASVTWAGQATCLIGLGGRWFLTDPNLSPRVGAFVKRLVEPGFTADALPGLDAAVVSHGHLDHMDAGTLASLPRESALLLPPGTSGYLKRIARSKPAGAVRELPHWQSEPFGGVTVTAVPAIHDGARWGVDALLRDIGVSGFVFQSDEATVYYTGDTAYDPELFKEVGRRFSPDVLICPIGPLEPRWLMIHFHADPKDALAIFADTGAAHLLPVHHNTFVQSWEAPTGAIREFFALRGKHPRGGDTFALRQGDQAIYRRDGGRVVLGRVRSPYPEGFADPRIPGDPAG